MRFRRLMLLMVLVGVIMGCAWFPSGGEQSSGARATSAVAAAPASQRPSPSVPVSPTVGPAAPTAALPPTPSAAFTPSPTPLTWWHPRPRTTWQIQLNSGNIDTHYHAQVYDIDLFDTPAATIAALHRMGRKVVCYFSAGTYENWRPDTADFPPGVVGKPLEAWEGEYYLDIRRLEALAPVMRARMDLAVQKGCDAVDPDNVQNYLEDTGFPLTAADQLRYNRWLAAEAHRRGLAVGLKNDLPQIPELVGVFDFAVSEECFTYDQCAPLKRFVTAHKAVFAIEYEATASAVCPRANAWGFSLLLKPWDLSAWRYSCLQDWKKE